MTDIHNVSGRRIYNGRPLLSIAITMISAADVMLTTTTQLSNINQET